MRGFHCGVALAYGLSLLGCGSTEYDSDNPGVRWLGRVEETLPGARFAWPGSGFEAHFEGTTATAIIATRIPDFFQLVIDGTHSSVFETGAGRHTYTLAQGLAPGEHHVLLWRRTESSAGTLEIGPVAFGDGTALAAPSPHERRLEIIGDSISAGYGVDCTRKTEPFSFATANHYLTYGAVAARELEAELHTIAWSGIGMLRDVNGRFAEQMPVRYERTIASDASSRWDFSRYTPHAVIVHLGTNDFVEGDPGTPFFDAYVTFVQSVRERYPDARIYVALSPMLAGDDRASLQAYLEQVLAARASEGDDNLAMIEFQNPTADEGWGCGEHPSSVTHGTMAALLVETLRTDLGW